MRHLDEKSGWTLSAYQTRGGWEYLRVTAPDGRTWAILADRLMGVTGLTRRVAGAVIGIWVPPQVLTPRGDHVDMVLLRRAGHTEDAQFAVYPDSGVQESEDWVPMAPAVVLT